MITMQQAMSVSSCGRPLGSRWSMSRPRAGTSSFSPTLLLTPPRRFSLSAPTSKAKPTRARKRLAALAEDVHPFTKRAEEINDLPPLDILLRMMHEQKYDGKPWNVLFWFRNKDLRVEDNRALAAAAWRTRKGTGLLLACYLWSPKDLDWHGSSPARTDFLLRNLQLLKMQLKDLNIPLAILTADRRGEKSQKIFDFMYKHQVSHLYANLEYEVDELRRDIDLFKRLAEGKRDNRVLLFHDQTVVDPRELCTEAGGPLTQFTPYHEAWLAKVAKEPELLDLVTLPARSGKDALKDNRLRYIFAGNVPALPHSKLFDSEKDQARMRNLWPAGREAGMERLREFLDNKVATYHRDRVFPALDNTSRLSPYFAAGVISLREVIKACRDANDGKDLGNGDAGVDSWVREMLLREFYRDMHLRTPHDATNLPHSPEFDAVAWENDYDGWRKWCAGTTGVPFVDAGMRQLRAEAYMHNRVRMITSSYLRTNLLIDYRRGERFFAESLVDWDLGSNAQGWEPSATVLDPVAEAEKFDPDGQYIRKWVPELKGVRGKAIFDPHGRLPKEQFEKLKYPAPHVDFRESTERWMDICKKGRLTQDK